MTFTSVFVVYQFHCLFVVKQALILVGYNIDEHVLHEKLIISILVQILMSVPLRTEDASVIVPTQWAASSASVPLDTLCNRMD